MQWKMDWKISHMSIYAGSKFIMCKSSKDLAHMGLKTKRDIHLLSVSPVTILRLS